MRLNKRFLVICFLATLFSCNTKIKENKDEKNDSGNQVNIEVKDVHIFKNKLVEEIRNKMLELTNKKSVKIDTYEKILFDDKNYYFVKINDSDEYSYLINYNGFNVENMLLKVNKVNKNNMEDIEKLSTILIQVSDDRINEERSKSIYIDLLVGLGEKIDNKVILENGLSYEILVNKKEELIFIIQ
jgi:hypothetical protein